MEVSCPCLDRNLRPNSHAPERDDGDVVYVGGGDTRRYVIDAVGASWTCPQSHRPSSLPGVELIALTVWTDLVLPTLAIFPGSLTMHARSCHKV